MRAAGSKAFLANVTQQHCCDHHPPMIRRYSLTYEGSLLAFYHLFFTIDDCFMQPGQKRLEFCFRANTLAWDLTQKFCLDTSIFVSQKALGVNLLHVGCLLATMVILPLVQLGMNDSS